MKRTLEKSGQIVLDTLTGQKWRQSSKMLGHLTDLSKTGTHMFMSLLTLCGMRFGRNADYKITLYPCEVLLTFSNLQIISVWFQ